MNGVDEIKITVVIAERSYRLTVNKADEAKVMKAAEMLNERIKSYKQTYTYPSKYRFPLPACHAQTPAAGK